MIEIKRKGIKREDRKLGVPKTERRTKNVQLSQRIISCLRFVRLNSEKL